VTADKTIPPPARMNGKVVDIERHYHLVQFPAEVEEALQRHAAEQGVPARVIIREAIRGYLGLGGAQS
jgi:hypothetical protein